MQAVGQTGRHLFWLSNSAPVRPAWRLGQAAPAPDQTQGGGTIPVQLEDNTPEPVTRLDGLTIAAIQNRILVDPAVQRYAAAVAAQGQQRGRGFGKFGGLAVNPLLQTTLPTLSDQDKAVLSAIAEDPTDEELKELSLIDGFFQAQGASTNPSVRNEATLTKQVCAGPQGRGLGAISFARLPTTGQIIAQWLTYKPVGGRFGSAQQQPNATSDEVDAIKNSKFYCGDVDSWAYPNDIHLDWPSFFGIDPSQTWGQIKRQVKNAVTMIDGMNSYPFPPPLDQYVFQYWNTVQSQLVQFTKGARIQKEGFRYFITMTVIMNYNDMVNRIEADLKRKAKKAKRKGLMTAIGVAVLGVIAPFLLPVIVVAVASLIKVAIDTYMAIKQRQEAAKQMADTAKMFANDAPAFASEVTKLSDLMDAQTAEAQASIPLPPDIAAEVGQPPPQPQPIIFGLGVAAFLGLTAIAVFKK